jgi:hypothetical protein
VDPVAEHEADKNDHVEATRQVARENAPSCRGNTRG